MTPEEKKDVISRVVSLMAEDITEMMAGAEIGGITIHTTAQVRDAIHTIGRAFVMTVDDGVPLEDWS